MNVSFFLYNEVKCEALSSIAEGEGQITTNGSQTYISYTCPVGYTLAGDVTNFCSVDGTWTSSVPSCGKILSYYPK